MLKQLLSCSPACLARPLLVLAASLVGCTSQPDSNQTPKEPATTARQPTATGPATAQYAGQYWWGKTAGEEPSGLLTVYPESDSTVLFQVDANGGAPAYHLANVLGRATLRGKTAFYFAKAPEDEKGCRLRIAFTPDAATVASVPGYTQDCLFGGSFTPDGTYQRISRQAPAYVLDSAGDTLRFAKLPPEQLQNEQPLPGQ
ncbi:hypothetical protein [Hymenobacter cellulosilyticus]|uniref:Lipoprotein n=1 Tax=Hymenobacter cellulosilyticus TaxID=2932248 RepID=A0A8T9Q620_9BACT|nr:hypothetical protein [Hymenobacter cellulosilyticus]UOQ72555.1 hypothetical protein MUN79_00685 [Hymenobacter cellulosilyticus]